MGLWCVRLLLALVVLPIPAWAVTSEQVNTDATQTLTNKTLTAPTITNPSVTGTVAGGASYSSVTLTSPTLSGSIGGSPTFPSPGAIGAGTASTGRFTTLTATTALVVGTPTVSAGAGSPEGAVTAVVGSLFLRTNGSTGTTFYIKESGSGNTGWVPFSTSAVSWSTPGTIGSGTPNTGAFTTLSATGQFTSTVSTGTAPFGVASTTKVTNLNSDLLDGADWAAPAAIGSTTPAALTGTTVQANTGFNGSSAITIRWGTGSPEGAQTANVGSLYFRTDGGVGTVLYSKESGTGNTGWVAVAPATINWASPGTIGSGTPNTGAFTMVSGTRYVTTLVAPTYGTTVSINAASGGIQVITATNATGFTIANPTSATTGQVLAIRVKNTSGGVLGTITWDTLYKLASFTKPAANMSRTVTFYYDGTNWIELNCSPEVPN